jgi:hypothetical protein
LVIIDEFDNVVVDRGLDITMLSTSSPGMESLWLVHGFIYSVIKTQVSQKSDLRNIHPEFLRKTLGLKEYGCKVSISSTLYERGFHTNFVSAAFF